MNTSPRRLDITFQSTKTYNHSIGLSCAFRQWRAESHCRFIHGYALKVHFVFEARTLDIRNWVVDFGSLKSLKGWLEDTFDHKLIIADDDPERITLLTLGRLGVADVIVVSATGCERFAEWIYEYTEQWLIDAGYSRDRVLLRSVEVSEHEGNSAIVEYRGESK